MKKTAHHLAQELFARARGAPSQAITEAKLARLPEPVRAYLRYARVVGRKMIQAVRLRQIGLFRMRPDQKWQPITAEQYFTTDPPGFVWHGTIRPIPFVSVSAVDSFSGGHGDLLIKLMSLVTLAHERGPEIDQGEFLRYLAEIAWFPTAWLSDAIRWEAVDGQSARVTLAGREITASASLSFDPDGRLTGLNARRYYQKNLENWSGRYSEYREFHGLLIPTLAEVTWNLDSGDFCYFRGEIIEIEYDHPSPY